VAMQASVIGKFSPASLYSFVISLDCYKWLVAPSLLAPALRGYFCTAFLSTMTFSAWEDRLNGLRYWVAKSGFCWVIYARGQLGTKM